MEGITLYSLICLIILSSLFPSYLGSVSVSACITCMRRKCFDPRSRISLHIKMKLKDKQPLPVAMRLSRYRMHAMATLHLAFVHEKFPSLTERPALLLVGVVFSRRQSFFSFLLSQIKKRGIRHTCPSV